MIIVIMENKGEIDNKWYKVEGTSAVDKYYQNLTKLIGYEAVSYVEGKGHRWEYGIQKGKFGDSEFCASFNIDSWRIGVQKWDIALDEIDMNKIVGVYRQGEKRPLIEEMGNLNKKGVSVYFKNNNSSEGKNAAFLEVNSKLSPGAIGMLQELTGFVSLIKGNVFLFPTEERRLNLYQRFFESAKFTQDFKGTYYLFKPSPA